MVKDNRLVFLQTFLYVALMQPFLYFISFSNNALVIMPHFSPFMGYNALSCDINAKCNFSALYDDGKLFAKFNKFNQASQVQNLSFNVSMIKMMMHKRGLNKMLNMRDLRYVKNILSTNLLSERGKDQIRNVLSQYPVLKPVMGHYLITSKYGKRMHPFFKRRIMHSGIDIVSDNKVVHASGSGTVICAKYSRSYGNIVIIEHRNGYFSKYAHLKKMYVNAGQYVNIQSPIGIIGNTGMSSGRHLHFEIIKNNKSINPIYIFA